MNDFASSFIRGLVAAPALYFRPLLPSRPRLRKAGLADTFEPAFIVAQFYSILAQVDRTHLHSQRDDLTSILGILREWVTEEASESAGLIQIESLVARIWNNELCYEELSLRASFAAGFFRALALTPSQPTDVFRANVDYIADYVRRATVALQQKMIPRSAPLIVERYRRVEDRWVDTA